MIVLFYILNFILGTAVGSFLGVIVDRLASKEAIWKGRSHCDHCRHMLHFFDLIPLISFFILGRKCRYCHKELSWFYPMIELTTGLVFLAAGYAIFHNSEYQLVLQPYQLLLLYYFSLIGALLVILFPYLSFSPLEKQLLGLQTNILSIVLSAIGAGGFFFLLFAVTKGRGMGFGDVVYAFLMGFTLGFPRVIMGLYIAFVTGALVSIALVLLRKKKFKGGTIPFGPFLVFGTFVSLFWGIQLIDYVLRFLTT